VAAVIAFDDLDQSHDWDDDAEVAPDPHSSGYQCRRCKIYICKFCAPDESDDFDAATKPCPGVPRYEISSDYDAAERMLDVIHAAYRAGDYGRVGELLHSRELYGTDRAMEDE
jgi:hypothetical protein